MHELVSYADASVGKLLDALQGSNTLVWLMSDNSAAYTGKGRGTQRGAGVVSVVWGGGVKARGVVSELTDSTDVAPTLCAAFGVAPPDGADGVNLLPYLRGDAADAPRSWAAAEIGGTRVVASSAAVHEAANPLLHAAAGRLYLVSGDTRCDASVLRPLVDAATRSLCVAANATLDAARRFFVPHRKRPHRRFYAATAAALHATAHGRAFIAYHENEREEHLGSSRMYARRDESAGLSAEYDIARSSGLIAAITHAEAALSGSSPSSSSACENCTRRLTSTVASMAIPHQHYRTCSKQLSSPRPRASSSDVRFLVVMEDGRVGSTWLTDMLNAHPNVTCVEEELAEEGLIHDAAVRNARLDAYFGPSAMLPRNEPYSSWVVPGRPHGISSGERVSTYARGAKQKYGAVGRDKLLGDKNNWTQLDKLANEGVRIICLARTNPMEFELAHATGDAHQDACNTHHTTGSEKCASWNITDAVRDAVITRSCALSKKQKQKRSRRKSHNTHRFGPTATPSIRGCSSSATHSVASSARSDSATAATGSRSARPSPGLTTRTSTVTRAPR